MNPNQILLWTVCLSCISLLVQMVRLGRQSGWGWIAGTILVVTLALAYFAPTWSSLVGGSLWAILLVIPLCGLNRLNTLVSQQRYRHARELAQWLQLLHPMDGLPEYPKLLEALEMGQNGDFERATKILSRYHNSPTPLGRTAVVLLYRMAGRWQDLLLWIEENCPPEILQTDVELMFFYLRALGETGDLNGLLQGLTSFEQLVGRTGDRQSLALARMMVFAFCGDPAQVKLMFEHQLANYSASFQSFWLATAESACGDLLRARETFADLCNSGDASLCNAAKWRLSRSQVEPHAILTASSMQILERLGREVHQENMYGKPSRRVSQKAYGTFLLIGINLVVFAIELFAGGSEDIEVLYRLGALVPTVILQGEWWRLLSATFLHFGYLHLALNMLGLYYLGIFVELKLGIWRYLATYLFCGVGSMLVVTILAIAQNVTGQITVGASGAIMGMVGVTGAILFQAWRREKSRFAAQRLRTIIAIVCLQMFFDLTTPNVSAIGHTSGLTLGFLIGMFLA
ncbi:rhomboid family intramembrane serine protease [Pseudanabaena sp. PCC 6802]|uniref:rhomboid family intramembrane serine protease n=1 Tax=Pseudanabaena sp. PCC 6802 TaxID=118173 RepID=UPI00034BD5C0|nr:rhomboid family intramembrane serine protease [Pseudanabaena sp. PCC 6802]